MSKSGIERRRAERKPLQLEVTLHVGGGGNSKRGMSTDISMTGIFILLSDPPPVGSRVDLIIGQRGEEGLVVVGGKVVHSIPSKGVGIEFNPPGPQSRQRIAELLGETTEPKISQ